MPRRNPEKEHPLHAVCAMTFPSPPPIGTKFLTEHGIDWELVGVREHLRTAPHAAGEPTHILVWRATYGGKVYTTTTGKRFQTCRFWQKKAETNG